MTYHQRLAAAWPDPVEMKPGPAAKPAAKAAPAPAEKPPFMELARAKSAAQHARQLLEKAWPDGLSAVDKGQDDPDPDQARAEELREIDEDIALLNRRRARLTGEGKG